MAFLLAIPALLVVHEALDAAADGLASVTSSIHQKCVDFKRKLTPKRNPNGNVNKKHEYSQEYCDIVAKHHHK